MAERAVLMSRVRLVLPLGLGAVAALGQAPHDWWWATLAAMVAFIGLFDKRQSGGRALGAGFLLGLGYFLVALRWIQEPFQVEADIYGWMAPFALLFLSAGMALFWAAAIYAAHKFGRHIPFAIVLCLTAAEAARSLILTGFPWALLGHIWIDTPLAQLAAWGGPHLLTLLALTVAAGLAGVARGRWGAAAIPVAALVLMAALRLPTPAPFEGPIVRLVQPNVPQIEKWDLTKRDAHLERLLLFTSITPRPDVVIWPETAIPVLLDFAGESLDAMADATAGVPLVFGINRHQDRTFHNSFAVLGAAPDPIAFYDKKHLVPFGEFIPFGEILAKLGLPGYAASQGGGVYRRHPKRDHRHSRYRDGPRAYLLRRHLCRRNHPRNAAALYDPDHQ